MDEQTLALLGQLSEPPDTDPSPDVQDPSDLGEQQSENPESAPPANEIPEGYTRDRQTGEIRPKKTRGRPRNGTPPPRPTEPVNRKPDESPDPKAKGKVPAGTPKWQKGVIALGMTKLYKRAGRLVKVMDSDIGTAIIESAEDCGEAWDELARTNPRVRAFLMKMVTGGAWGSILMAHLPILMAVIMKERIRQHIPFMSLIDVMGSDEAEDDSEDGGDDANPFGDFLSGMSAEDMRGMADLAQSLFGQTARRVVPGTVIRGDGEVA